MQWLKQLLTRRKIYSDLSEEIEQHLAEKTDALMAEGVSRAQAERAAKREFGNVTRIEERGRETWMWPLIESLWAEAKFALRQLRKDYGFALTATLTLALGIGSTTAIFSLVNAVLLQPLPFPDQDRLMWISQQDHSLPGVAPEALSYPDYFDFRAQNHTFSGIAAYAGGGVTLETGGESQRIDSKVVSSNFFEVLGIAPMLGRDFRADEEKPGNRAVMMSYSLWRSSFGSDREIAGKTVRMDDRDYVVAGVMPEGFQFPLDGSAPGLWISIAGQAEGDSPVTKQRGFNCLGLIGRLKTGTTLQQVKADLNLIAGNLAQQYPESDKQYGNALIEPELRHITGDTRPALRILFGAVALVLLIACANVAGLLLARSSKRRAEFALRAAIGASRAAIVRQLLVESLMLSLSGGILGTGLAYLQLHSMVSLIPLDIPRMDSASIDWRVLVFVLLLSLVTGLLFGLSPAWKMSQSKPAEALRSGSRGLTGGRGQHRVHNGLVITQTAIGLILLIGSGLLIQSLVRMLRVDPGFDASHVLTARVRLHDNRMSHEQRYQFYTQLSARLAAMPGVQSTSAGWPLPMSDNNIHISFLIKGQPVAKGDEPNASVGIVMPGYFATMKIPLIAGRAFSEQDNLTGAPTIIVNQAFARRYFPNDTAIGKYIEAEVGDDVFNHSMRQVVGVVGDIKTKGLTSDAEPQYYLPFAQAMITNLYVTTRTSGDPAAMQASISEAVHQLDKSVPVYQVMPLENYLSRSTAQPRFQAFLLTCFAAIALLLAAVGLYGLLSYMVAQRTLEIGLRMALGAQRSSVLGMIVRQGLMLTAVGLTLGLAISAALTRLLAGMLYGIGASDPLTFVSTTALLLLVCVAASCIPAYRAARLDPMRTLRDQ